MLTAFGTYLLAHFLIYAAFLRRLPIIRTERGIFLYHFVPAVIAASAALLIGLSGAGFDIAGFTLVVSLHGIYSLSFLELWSLAQGGYSLSVMERIAEGEKADTDEDFAKLAEIGVTKQRARIATLARLGLITMDAEHISLTKRGIRVATLLDGVLAWVAPNARP